MNKWTSKEAVQRLGLYVLKLYKTGASHTLTLGQGVDRFRALSPRPAKIRPIERRKVEMVCPGCALRFEGFPAPREGRVTLLIQYDKDGYPVLYKKVGGERSYLGYARKLIHPDNIPALDPDMPRRWFRYRSVEFRGNKIVRYDPETKRTRLARWDGHKSVSPRAKPE